MRSLMISSFLVLTIIVLSTGDSFAIITTEHLTDQELVAMMTENAFCSEGRIGDQLGAATFELDIGSEHSNPAQTAQFEWPNGTPVAFTLSYDSQTNSASFTVGSTTLVFTPVPPFTEIFVRARAVNEGSSMLVYDLVLDGEPVPDSASTEGPGGADTVWISGGELSDGFTLTGMSLMTWSGEIPTQSRLAYQVKPSALGFVPVERSSWGRAKSLSD